MNFSMPDHVAGAAPVIRRRLLMLGGGLLAAAALTPLAGPTVAARKRRKKKKHKKRKFRIVTRSFNNPEVIALDDDGEEADPYPSVIQVSGFKQGRLLDLEVTLRNLAHNFPNDLDLLLEAPNGRRAKIMSDTGAGFAVANVTLTLDDQAAANLPFPLTSGRFKPTDLGDFDTFPAPAADTTAVALATFNGIDPNGTWRLFVVDDLGLDTGRFAGGWSMTIKARVRK